MAANGARADRLIAACREIRRERRFAAEVRPPARYDGGSPAPGFQVSQLERNKPCLKR
jgi:hypothetical protein